MKHAIVTGASAGIGLATARRFLEEGFEVICFARRLCPEEGVKSYSIDLAKDDLQNQVQKALDEIFHTQSRIEIHLIHNAALMLKDEAASMADEDFKRVMQINVFAANTLNRLLIPRMGEGSSVVFVGSTLATKAVAGTFSYVTSKHAQVGMMRALCQDLAGLGIHTASICPGFTDTEMLRTHVDEAELTAIAKMTAFNRIISAEEVAATIYWATLNPVINGSVIHANLGQLES